ncbi:hypothetical protein LBMAG49_28660 [Planctomycetota bacterium]|nr:hypothetical protein LBMAG49_28660 [Planctomycetota bacterium]
MLLKRIEAKTLAEAIARVAAECGDDALVVETRPTRNGYLVVATRPETQLAPIDQAGRKNLGDSQRWTRGFAPMAQRASEFGLSNRLLAAIEQSLLGTRVELGRVGDPALGGLCARILQALVKVEPRFEGKRGSDQFRAIAMVGSTGVGKTTTLAKLASRAVQNGEDIAILTVDTYRVAAVEQLRAFADLLEVPIEVAFTPQDLRRLLQLHSHRDRIFLDTTGKSPLDRTALQTLAGALSGKNFARLLCMPAGMRRCDADMVLDSYDKIGIDGVCLTKWDETLVPGESLSAIIERGLPLSHLAIGQDVPADILAADSLQLAQAAFGLEPTEVLA